MERSVTAILLNWRREKNVLTHCLPDLRAEGCQVWLHDNDSDGAHSLYRHSRSFDYYRGSHQNEGCCIRWQLAALVETDYVLVMDDDLTIVPGAIERMVQASAGERVVCAFGRRLAVNKPYGKCPLIVRGRVDICLGRLILIPREQAKLTWPCPEKFEDDIYASSRFTAEKFTTPKLTRELDPGPRSVAVCARPGHYQNREAARRRWFDK